MCRCILTTEERFKEELSLKNDDYKDVKVEYTSFENKMIAFKDGKVRLVIPINIEGTKINKKGKEVKVKKNRVPYDRILPILWRKTIKGECCK